MTLAPPYDVLVPWCKQAQNSGKSADDLWALLNQPSVPVVGRVTRGAILLALTPSVILLATRSAGMQAKWTPVFDTLKAADDTVDLNQVVPIIQQAVADGVVDQTSLDALQASGTRQLNQLQVWNLDVRYGNVVSALALIQQGA